jgi:hypothetical protein
MMMIGMFGIGLLFMVLVIALPVVLIVLVLGGVPGLLQNRSSRQYEPPVQPKNIVSTPSPTTGTLTCAHCGAGLQADWVHCPQCGAPVK